VSIHGQGSRTFKVQAHSQLPSSNPGTQPPSFFNLSHSSFHLHFRHLHHFHFSLDLSRHQLFQPRHQPFQPRHQPLTLQHTLLFIWPTPGVNWLPCSSLNHAQVPPILLINRPAGWASLTPPTGQSANAGPCPTGAPSRGRRGNDSFPLLPGGRLPQHTHARTHARTHACTHTHTPSPLSYCPPSSLSPSLLPPPSLSLTHTHTHTHTHTLIHKQTHIL